MASQIATKKSKRNPPEICGDAFVVVTVEEIELSLSSVVALPSDDEDEGSDAVLEARVLATQQVAAVHELALLERAAAARTLARRLKREAADPPASPPSPAGDDGARVAELRGTLAAAAGPAAPRDATPARGRVEAALGGGASAAALVAAASAPGGARVALSARDLPMRGGAPKPTTKKDASEQQSRRDIERDCLVVDGGAPLQGGRVGYDRIVDAIAAAQARLVARAAADEWRPVDGAEYSDFAKAALRAVNRTESGGAGLEAVTFALAGPDGAPLLVPVPDSKGAEPLRLSFKLGPAACPSGGGWRWGIRAQVQGATFYRLFAPDDFDTEVLRARATYANSLLLPLDGLGDAAPLYDRGAATVDVDVFAEAAPL